MGNVKHEIEDLCENNPDLEKDRSPSDTKEVRLSLERCALRSIRFLPSSSNNEIKSPQPNCIYVDSVHKEYIARTESPIPRYKNAVILGLSKEFDENAKEHKQTLYLVEEATHILLYYYDGTQWCSIARERAAAVQFLTNSGFEQGECSNPVTLEKLTSFYSGKIFRGKLEGLSSSINLNQIDTFPLEREKILKSVQELENRIKSGIQKEEEEQVKKDIAACIKKAEELENKIIELKENIIQKILADASPTRKRARDSILPTSDEPLLKKRNMNARRCLGKDFQDIYAKEELDCSNSSLIIIDSEPRSVEIPLNDGIVDLTCSEELGGPLLKLPSPLQTIDAEFSPFSNGDTGCGQRASGGLEQADSHCSFWKESNASVEVAIQATSQDGKPQTTSQDDEPKRLIQGVTQEDSTAYRDFATALLETGKADNAQLAIYLIGLAEEAEKKKQQGEQSRQRIYSSATGPTSRMFQDPSLFEFQSLNDDIEEEEEGRGLQF